MGYRIGYNGPEVDKLLQKAHTYSVVNNGWAKLDSSDTDPIDLNTLVTIGNYSISFWKNGPVQLTTSGPINVCITKNNTSNTIYQTIYDAGKIYIRETTSASFSSAWKEEQNDTELDISSAEPVNPVDNYIWIDPSNDSPVIKIYRASTGTWVNIAPADMAKQSVYDSKNVKQNIETYLNNKIHDGQLDNAEELYSQHIIEGEDTNNPIHVTAQEKLKWSNGISETDAQTHIDALKTEMTQYSDEKIQEKSTSVNTINSTITEDKKNINAHINDNTIHLTEALINEFNDKAAGDHKHLNNGSVTVSSKNLTGLIPIERLDPSVLERNYTVNSYNEMLQLTKEQVQNGDSVYIKGSTETSNSSSAYFVIDDTKLGTDAAFIRYAAPNVELTWDNILNKPTSISDYGVTNVYTSEEINQIYNEIITSLDNSNTIANEFNSEISVTVPTNLTETYTTNLAAAAELNQKLDELLKSLGLDDTKINSIIDLYKNKSIEYVTTQEPLVAKIVNVKYMYLNPPSDSIPTTAVNNKPSDTTYNIEYNKLYYDHIIDDNHYPEGYTIDSDDGSGYWEFSGWDVDTVGKKDVSVSYHYVINGNSALLPNEVINNKPTNVSYDVDCSDPQKMNYTHTIDDNHYPAGYSVDSTDGSGYWEFSGWEIDTIGKKTVTVSYQYTVNGDSSLLPSEIISNMPNDSIYNIDYNDEQKTNYTHTIDDNHYPAGYSVDSTDGSGYWEFSGWVKS